MVDANDYHDFSQREADHIYVEVPDRFNPDRWISSTRVAQHGAEKLIRDGAMPRSKYGGEARRTFRLIWDWGSGPEVIVTDGVVTKDTRPA